MMMRQLKRYKIFFLVCLCLCLVHSENTLAETSVSAGPVSGTWNVSGSPYIVEGDIEIESGTTLTVSAGVIVKFNGNFSLSVYGTLSAIGTESDPITFSTSNTTPASGDWQGLGFFSGSHESRLEYCIVEYASVGIYFRGNTYDSLGDEDTTIIDSEIRNNTTGIYLYPEAHGSETGCWHEEQKPTIDSCDIHDNTTGVFYHGTASGWSCGHRGESGGELSNNSIYNNNTGISLNCSGGIPIPNVHDNDIYSNSNYGIRIYGNDSTNSIIKANMIYNNQYGIYCEDSGSRAKAILNNKIYGNSLYGIYNGSDSLIILQGNEIYNNTSYGVNTAEVAIFTDNSLHDNGTYDFYYRGATDQVAVENDWGTLNASVIDSHIYDHLDDPLLGRLILNASDLEVGTILGFVTAGGDAPQGLAYDGTYFWNADFGDYKIYKLDTAGNVIDSFSSPGTYPTGLTYDGTYLWNADWIDDKIYKLDTAGNIIFSFDSPGTQPQGLAFDGTYLWNADSYDDKIYKLDTAGNIIDSFNSPGIFPTGLTYDGTFLWNVDIIDDKIYKLDTAGNVIKSFNSPGTFPRGLTFDGAYLWNADSYENKLYKLYFKPAGHGSVPPILNLLLDD